jgi:hypothetical protein
MGLLEGALYLTVEKPGAIEELFHLLREVGALLRVFGNHRESIA